jgi:hypothetical protein
VLDNALHLVHDGVVAFHAASRSTPMTTSAKYVPPEERTRTPRTSVTPGSAATADRTFVSAPAGALSMRALRFQRARRTAPRTTSTATNRAAMASARGWPRAVSASPAMTAIVPAKSVAKCTALAPSAALPSLRAARADVVARAASITSTTASRATAYQVARTSPPPPPRRTIAATAIQAAASTRITASPSAERFCALP